MSEILSPNRYVGRIAAVRLIVVHTMEVDENDVNVAESVGRAFANPARKASSHVGIDVDSECRYVADENTAWAAPGCNADGLQMELAGRAAQSSADWSDAASQAILERAAQRGAIWAHKFNVPVKHLSVNELLAGARGFIGHYDATLAYHQTDHTDPGAHFPWDAYLARINQILGGAAPVPSPEPAPATLVLVLGSLGSAVRRVQTFLGCEQDGVFGTQTQTAVKTYQRGVGLKDDGVVGPLTWAKIDAGVRPTVAPAPAPVTHIVTPGIPAPAFPLATGSYFGPVTGPKESVSGVYSHREDFRRWQQRMKDRGWGITADGIYGPQSAGVAHAFQVEKGLLPDSLVGPVTWAAAWTAPITY